MGGSRWERGGGDWSWVWNLSEVQRARVGLARTREGRDACLSHGRSPDKASNRERPVDRRRSGLFLSPATNAMTRTPRAFLPGMLVALSQAFLTETTHDNHRNLRTSIIMPSRYSVLYVFPFCACGRLKKKRIMGQCTPRFPMETSVCSLSLFHLPSRSTLPNTHSSGFSTKYRRWTRCTS